MCDGVCTIFFFIIYGPGLFTMGAVFAWTDATSLNDSTQMLCASAHPFIPRIGWDHSSKLYDLQVGGLMEFLTSFYALMRFLEAITQGKRTVRMAQKEIWGTQTSGELAPASAGPKVWQPYWELINKWSDVRLRGRLVNRGVSHLIRQRSRAKVAYKPRSFAGTEHKAPGGWVPLGLPRGL